jgi:L-fuconolactonase
VAVTHLPDTDQAASKPAAWLDLVHEDVIDPGIEICDAHHHLWKDDRQTYLLDDLLTDLKSGHNVVQTVYVEGLTGYRIDGPAEHRPVGETVFAVQVAEAAQRMGRPIMGAIIGYADLGLGQLVGPILDAHLEAGQDRMRAVRTGVAWVADPTIRNGRRPSGPSLLRSREFREGLEALASRQLAFDAWIYHPQMPDLAAVAKEVPEVTIVLDHLGGPLGIGEYQDRGASMQVWRDSITELANCRNVFVKIGGIGMATSGLALHRRAEPPTSVELAAVWGDDIRHCIDAFGPDRCMFESNFPVDRKSFSYTVLWNTFKRIASSYTASERHWLFHDTAAAVYRLPSLR